MDPLVRAGGCCRALTKQKHASRSSTNLTLQLPLLKQASPGRTHEAGELMPKNLQSALFSVTMFCPPPITYLNTPRGAEDGVGEGGVSESEIFLAKGVLTPPKRTDTSAGLPGNRIGQLVHFPPLSTAGGSGGRPVSSQANKGVT